MAEQTSIDLRSPNSVRDIMANVIDLSNAQNANASKKMELSFQAGQLADMTAEATTKVEANRLAEEQKIQDSINRAADGTEANLRYLLQTQQAFDMAAIGKKADAAKLGAIRFWEHPIDFLTSRFAAENAWEDAVAYEDIANSAAKAAQHLNANLATGINNLKEINRVVTTQTQADKLEAFALMAKLKANEIKEQELTFQSGAIKEMAAGNATVMQMFSAQNAMANANAHTAIAREHLNLDRAREARLARKDAKDNIMQDMQIELLQENIDAKRERAKDKAAFDRAIEDRANIMNYVAPKIGITARVPTDSPQATKAFFDTVKQNPQFAKEFEAWDYVARNVASQIAMGADEKQLRAIYGPDAYTALENRSKLQIKAGSPLEKKVMELTNRLNAIFQTPGPADPLTGKATPALMNTKNSRDENANVFNQGARAEAARHATNVEADMENNIYAPVPPASMESIGAIRDLTFFQQVLKPRIESGDTKANTADVIVEEAVNAAEQGIIQKTELMPTLETIFQSLAAANNVQANYSGHGLPAMSTYNVITHDPLTDKPIIIDMLNPSKLQLFIQMKKYSANRGFIGKTIDKHLTNKFNILNHSPNKAAELDAFANSRINKAGE
jgi:hypothetical protein